MIVLDASVLIAWLEVGHPFAAAATAILDTDEDLAVHPLTLAEVLVGAVRADREALVREALERLGVQAWTPDADEPARLARLRAGTGLKLPDCCVLDAAMMQRASVATFDERLAACARGRGIILVAGEPAA